MTPLPIEVLLGIYIGLLTGIVPAFVAGSLGFLFRYVTGVTLPGLGVVVLALAIAAVNGGLLALVDPTISQSPRLLVAVLVILMLSLYAHNQGDKLGAELPRRVSFRTIRQRTLSADAVEFVGGIGQVTVRPTGEVRDMEGYPPLPPELRNALKTGRWRLPADIPLSELEVRLGERLRTDHDLAGVSVSIDEQARATIAAAPPSSGLSKRIPEGKRAVSISALVPSGLARGDDVTVTVEGGADIGSVSGTVLSVRTAADDEAAAGEEPPPPAEATTDGGERTAAVASSRTTTAGGEGRVTIVVPRRDVEPLLNADRGRLVVQSRGSSREFEVLTLLKRAGYRVRKSTVGVDARNLGDRGRVGSLHATYDVTVLAMRRELADEGDHRAGWVFVPGSNATIDRGDQLFVVGTGPALDRFGEVISR